MGVPSLGKSVADAARQAREEVESQPKAEYLGEIKAKGPKYSGFTHTEVDPETQEEIRHLIEMEEGPPPWEITNGHGSSDARSFVDCPKEWELRWINPRLLDQFGWRGWQHVRPADPRVKLKIPSMRSVEGYIRRGGQTGDILAYMPKHWFKVKLDQREERNRTQTQSSVDRLRNLQEDFRRGTYGPNVTLENARHPTHTMIHPDEMRNERD